MLKLKTTATFKAKVAIPVPGVDPEIVEFEFRHKTRTQLDEWRAEGGTSEQDSLLKVVVGWDSKSMAKALSHVAEVEDAFAFSKETLAEVLDAIPGAGYAIGRDYGTALLTGRSGN